MIYEAKSKENSLILNSVDEVLAHILAARKIGEKERLEFLYPDINDLTQPCLYSNVDKIVVRVNKAITNKEKILIYGDYDCDGVCAVAILYNFFKDRDIDCNYFIPLRDEGYGLNIKSLDKIKQEYSPDLIITVDCGISSVAEVEECRKLGMEIIVTDHHEPGENLPNALIFNPKLDREKGLFSEYCGAGVAFKLVEAISGLDYAKKYLDVVSIATIGDIVPLVKDNRAIVKFGLCKINKSEKKVYKIFKQKLSVNEEFTSYDIAFKIVPRINAAGRLSSADKAVELFISDDYFNLTCLIEELCTLNTDRQKVCNKIYKEAITMLSSYDLSNRVIILKNPDWDAGV